MGPVYFGKRCSPFLPLWTHQQAVLSQCYLLILHAVGGSWLPFCVINGLCSKIYSVWLVDCSVYVMLLVTKLTYYARWLEKQKGETVSFIDYMAYHLFFPGVIVGPTFSFEVYLGFINNRF